MAFLLNKFSYIKVSVWGRIPVLSVVCLFPVSLSAGPAAGLLLSAQPPLSGSSPHHSATWYLKTHTHQNNNSIQLNNDLREKKKDSKFSRSLTYNLSGQLRCLLFKQVFHLFDVELFGLSLMEFHLQLWRCKTSKTFEPAISIWKHLEQSVHADISALNNQERR